VYGNTTTTTASRDVHEEGRGGRGACRDVETPRCLRVLTRSLCCMKERKKGG